MIPHDRIAGVVLAGGRGRRAGHRDKGWMEWAGRPLIEVVTGRLAPQVDTLALSVNRNQPRYAQLGYPLLADGDEYGPPATQGPLAGVWRALRWSPAPWLACVPCDLPRLPEDLVARLRRACGSRPAAYAVDAERAHYLCCLLSVDLAPALAAYLSGGGRAVHRWLRGVDAVAVDFSDRPDAFVNINNRPEIMHTAADKEA